ncbi:hypothetical protein SDC9_141020 [bioreactor metagenome]|uniref:Uncharacterized protein n=1 Tax=bioreactor metagenome TaxID=1076179 RepID=A0A645DXL7_9ZZZZ
MRLRRLSRIPHDEAGIENAVSSRDLKVDPGVDVDVPDAAPDRDVGSPLFRISSPEVRDLRLEPSERLDLRAVVSPGERELQRDALPRTVRLAHSGAFIPEAAF